MAETTVTLWTVLPFTLGDPNYNSRDRTPKGSFVEPAQKRTQNTTRNQWFIKLFRYPHFTDNFWSSSILLTWAEDGGSEQIAIRQPTASWRMICNEWRRQQEYLNIIAKHLNIAEKPVGGFIKLIKEWSACESERYIKYLCMPV